jgi:hypothetical protein
MVYAIEIPSTSDNFGIGLAGARHCIEQKQRSYVNLRTHEDSLLLFQRIRSNPNTALQTPKTPIVQITAQPTPVAVAIYRNIEKHQSPPAIPLARPPSLRIASAERHKPALRGEAVDTLVCGVGAAFDQLTFLQAGDLPKQSVSVGPGFIGVSEVPKSRAEQRVG